MNNTDVEAPNPCTPKHDRNCKLVPQIWLVDWNVVSGSTNMLIQDNIVVKLRLLTW